MSRHLYQIPSHQHKMNPTMVHFVIHYYQLHLLTLHLWLSSLKETIMIPIEQEVVVLYYYNYYLSRIISSSSSSESLFIYFVLFCFIRFVFVVWSDFDFDFGLCSVARLFNLCFCFFFLGLFCLLLTLDSINCVEKLLRKKQNKQERQILCSSDFSFVLIIICIH